MWLYVRFTLSFRDVEDLLAERGLDVSYETVRRWVLKFGPLFARELRRRRSRPTSQWHLDEMAVMIAGRQFWLWRAVDDEGEVLDLLVQRRRDKADAVKLMRKLLKKQGLAPDVLVTDRLRSYGAAKATIGLSARHERGWRALADLIGECLAELLPPLARGPVGHANPARSSTMRRLRETGREPNRMADHLRRKAMALVERVAGCRHEGPIAARPAL